MFNKNYKTLNSIRHVFSEGQEVYYSCLVHKFDWFEKIISIDEIVEPVKTTITEQKLIPDFISVEDKVIIEKLDLDNVVRKYMLITNFSNNKVSKSKVYEERNKEVTLVMENSHMVSHSIEENEEAFYQLVIQTKADIDFDSESKFNKDENYEIFKELYEKAADKFPEEVIRAHDRYKKNV